MENVAKPQLHAWLSKEATRGTGAHLLRFGACTGNTQTSAASRGGKAKGAVPGKGCHPFVA